MKTIYLSLIALIMMGCSEGPEKAATQPAPSLPVENVRVATTTTYQEYPVAIEGKANIEIRPQVDGLLTKIFVDEGAYVKAGQPLFKIEEQPYRENYNNALANTRSNEASLLNAELEVEKLLPLIENKVVSDYQLKTAKTNVKIAKSRLQQSNAELATAKIKLGYTLIKAPFEGYIGRLPKKTGNLVSVTDIEALTQLSDIKEVRAYFSLAETDFINFKSQYSGNTINDKIKNLLPVALILSDNTEYAQKGKIDMVDGHFDENTGAISLRATFPNANGLLRSGNTGKIKLGLEHKNALLIPQQATTEIQDKTYVFTVGQNNKVAKVPVTIVGKSGSDYLIGQGVKSGDRIVTKGIENLQDGSVIVPIKETTVIAQNN